MKMFLLLIYSTVFLCDLDARASPAKTKAEQNKSGTVSEKVNPVRKTKGRPSLLKPHTLPDIQKILKGGKLIVAQFSGERFPFYFTDDNGDRIGLDRSIAEEIAHSIHPDLKVEILNSAKTFNDTVDQVAKGEAHIAISKLSYTSERAKKVIYVAPPYVDLKVSFLIDRLKLAKLPANVSVAEMFSKKTKQKLCVLKDSSQVENAKFLVPDAELMYADTADHSYQLLFERKCTALFYDDNELRLKLMQNPNLNLNYKAVSIADKGDPISIIVGNDFSELADYISAQYTHNAFRQRHIKDEIEKYKGYLK
ncbi:MAG: hypothetical protein COY39_02495 [Alphaproteobacteria bacterium CG_4_10_14_0_8_um_filter_37_21]|nr:MAG: hypothetical protein COY39_02495 [Alphaproteobacteria bacterium CG_4_10_14_0_8_um_filter_37_21]